MQKRLEKNLWLTIDLITIADITNIPNIGLTPEDRLDLESYPAVIDWLSRIQALPGYVSMPGMWQCVYITFLRHFKIKNIINKG